MTIDELLQQAKHCYQLGQLQEAEKIYKCILQIQPNHAVTNHNLGMLAMQADQPALALPFLRNAWLNSGREQFCLALTECLLKLDRSSDALHTIKNAVQRKGFNSPQAIRLLQSATSIAEGDCPEFSIEQEISGLFHLGHHTALEERLTSLLCQYPNWRAGWDKLCTIQQIRGKDCEEALLRALKLIPDNVNANSRRKIFCIGANKTGTTTMLKVFEDLGLIAGDQAQAEMLVFDWARQDFRRLIRYCQSAEAFQDAPFSFSGTFQAMDEAFPGSKFILTVRNNADEWYESLVRFHTNGVGKGRVPTADDLRQANYRYPGFLLDVFKLRYGEDEAKLYDREMYMQWYESHCSKVINYFKNRPDDLLVLNVGEHDAMERLLLFLGYPYSGQKMPHLNASKD
jgi:tetratricopeptide (TPR) repeat protein